MNTSAQTHAEHQKLLDKAAQRVSEAGALLEEYYEFLMNDERTEDKRYLQWLLNSTDNELLEFANSSQHEPLENSITDEERDTILYEFQRLAQDYPKLQEVELNFQEDFRWVAFDAPKDISAPLFVKLVKILNNLANIELDFDEDRTTVSVCAHRIDKD